MSRKNPKDSKNVEGHQLISIPEVATLEIKTDSLAFSLAGAALAVSYVLEGIALPQALSRVFVQSQVSPQAKGAIQDIAYRTMRQVGRVDALITLMTSKPPEPPVLYGLLCCALTLLITTENEAAPYDDFVVVDQAVNAAASSSHMIFAKGMVNAVLRRFLREKQELLPMVMKQAAARWNYPQWWVDQCKAAYPESWQQILSAADTQPPMTLRINISKISTESYLEQLQRQGILATQIGPCAIRLHQPVPVQFVPGFSEGLVSVQDAAAQLAAELLDLKDGQQVLDACAAPGGKTGHILELAKVDLLALEIDPKRLDKIHENLSRLGLFASIKEGDASWSNWWDGRQFDRILADVPCTASGVVRRHPDIRWLRRKTDAAQLAVTSSRILDNLWRMLKPGGKLLLVTCSIWPIESENQAKSFMERHSAIRLDAPGQLLPTSELNNEHDGLFYALFQKPEI
ncbi:16S rRNA (cytosine(967)-C(5))-methyltransferase RsmB [Undibacterium sp. FT137W]|uniref:16S rRNA (cytosine(967)-C(5))-methyltransferase n=2 Tax=Undibacterium fentianense TaxID=2828728 RepID=A0A941IE21_9BURK|nr:16S rRNA (cytosine(967)-C(5))-methyltransferase RsmB [Undibacterium fentianense]